MACFDACFGARNAPPSPSRLRRVTTQTSVERLLPQDNASDAQLSAVMLAPPTLMRASNLPLPPPSPEPHSLARSSVDSAEFEGEDDGTYRYLLMPVRLTG